MRKRKSRKGWIGRGLYGIVLIGGLAGILLAVAQGVTVTLRPGVRGRPPALRPGCVFRMQRCRQRKKPSWQAHLRSLFDCREKIGHGRLQTAP